MDNLRKGKKRIQAQLMHTILFFIVAIHAEPRCDKQRFVLILGGEKQILGGEKH